MKRIFSITILTAAALWLGACNEQSVDTYKNDPLLYFYEGYIASEGYTQRDTSRMTFLDVPANEPYYDVHVMVMTTGFPSGKPRHVTFEQINAGEEGAAVAGRHYVAFDDPRMREMMVIPAEAVSAMIPVRLTRHESMEGNRFNLALRIVANDDFGPGFEDRIDHVVVMSEMYEMPKAWESAWQRVFGQWGQKKMWFITQVVGFNGMDSVDYSASFMKAMQIRAIRLLEEYNNDPDNPDRPLREADDTPVTFPDA